LDLTECLLSTFRLSRWTASRVRKLQSSVKTFAEGKIVSPLSQSVCRNTRCMLLRNTSTIDSMLQGKMSMTGSLMGYENNNDVNQAKCKKPLKPLPVVSSISSSGVTTSTSQSRQRSRRSTRRESCVRSHVNGLWSVWYGILAVAFQGYIAMRYARRFSGKIPLRSTSFRFARRRDRSAART